MDDFRPLILTTLTHYSFKKRRNLRALYFLSSMLQLQNPNQPGTNHNRKQKLIIIVTLARQALGLASHTICMETDHNPILKYEPHFG
jgi:hypothetical protein